MDYGIPKLTPSEFEAYLKELRNLGACNVRDVDFSIVTDEQCERIIEVLFGNIERKRSEKYNG